MAYGTSPRADADGRAAHGEQREAAVALAAQRPDETPEAVEEAQRLLAALAPATMRQPLWAQIGSVATEEYGEHESSDDEDHTPHIYAGTEGACGAEHGERDRDVAYGTSPKVDAAGRAAHGEHDRELAHSSSPSVGVEDRVVQGERDRDVAETVQGGGKRHKGHFPINSTDKRHLLHFRG